MKAAVYYETGAPDVLRYEDVPDPVLAPGGVRIEVEAISIEGGDTLNRLGGDMPAVPHIVGYQCGGTIAEVGAEVTDREVGPAGGGRDDARLPRRAGASPAPVSPGPSPTASTSPSPPASRSPSAPRTTASSSSAASRPARRCWSRPAPAVWASPPCSWPTGPGPRCSPPSSSAAKLERLGRYGARPRHQLPGAGLGRRGPPPHRRPGRGPGARLGRLDPAGQHRLARLPGPDLLRRQRRARRAARRHRPDHGRHPVASRACSSAPS